MTFLPTSSPWISSIHPEIRKWKNLGNSDENHCPIRIFYLKNRCFFFRLVFFSNMLSQHLGWWAVLGNSGVLSGVTQWAQSSSWRSWVSRAQVSHGRTQGPRSLGTGSAVAEHRLNVTFLAPTLAHCRRSCLASLSFRGVICTMGIITASLSG